MNFSRRTLISAALAAVLPVSAMAADVTLRFQHFLSPKASVPAFFMEAWADKIEADSDGRIKVELYPGMQLGGRPPALFDQIKDGVIDGGWALPPYTPGRFPGAEVFELPFMTARSAEATSMAFWEFYEKYLTEEFSDVKVLAVHVHGPGIIHSRSGPIASLDDFSGKKVRMPSRLAGQILEMLGATPIGMPVPAFPEALSKGVVDAGVIPWEVVPGLKVHELAKDHTVFAGSRNVYNTTFIWGMNKASYDKLPDDLKAVIDANSGLSVSGLAGAAMDKGDALGADVVAAAGNTIAEMPAEQVAEIEAMTAPIVAKWIEDMTAKGMPAAQMVEDARALIAKYDQ